MSANYDMILESVLRAFDGAHMIPIADACRFLGIDRRTAIKHLRIKRLGRNYYISAENIARSLD